MISTVESGASNQSVQFKIERSSKRRKTVTFKFLTPFQLQISAPDFLTQSELDGLIAQKRHWIAKQSQKLAGQIKHSLSSDLIWFLGQPYALSFHKSSRSELFLSYEKAYCFLKSTTQPMLYIKRWYHNQAKHYFQSRLDALSQLLPWVSECPVLKIRQMKQRWGSCDNRGIIILHTHLIKVPPSCIDYVILHELCHLKELNHSPAFYQLMDFACPNWRHYKNRLEQWPCG